MPLVVRAARLHPTRGERSEPVDVRVENGRIAAIRPHGEIPTTADDTGDGVPLVDNAGSIRFSPSRSRPTVSRIPSPTSSATESDEKPTTLNEPT